MHDHLSMGLLSRCPLCEAAVTVEELRTAHPEDCPEGLKGRVEFDVKEISDAEPQS